MPEDPYSATLRRPSGPSLRATFALILLAFLGGAALLGWLVWDGRIDLGGKSAAVTPPAAASKNFAAQPAASPAPSPNANSTPAAAAAGFEARVAALEARLARLNVEASATEGNTARAEAMMVAFATRRAIERGAELGFLGEQLKLRFGDAQPAAVAAVLDAAKAPVTLDKLAGDLDALSAALIQTPKNEGSWDRFTREISSLFVIRHSAAPSASPADRLDRARLLLRTGQTAKAIEEVRLLPGTAAANGWIGAAQRYAATQQALDQLETAALLEPERLRGSGGEALNAPSPAAAMPEVEPEGVF